MRNIKGCLDEKVPMKKRRIADYEFQILRLKYEYLQNLVRIGKE
jgi:hypothetical protein